MSGEITTENDNVGGLGDFVGTGNANSAQNFMQSIISDPQKRIIAIVVAALIVVGIIFIAVNSNKPDENQGKLVPLVREIDQSRAFEIIAKLKSVNIEAKVNNGEKPGEYVVEVYENAVETSYLALSRTNLLEDDDYGLFDSNDWAASDYDKRIKLQRAINGDLSRIISRMDGLRSATVRVNVPEQQLFTELQDSTTATVQIELENEGDELTKSQAKSIVNILRGYVPNLDESKISIVDTQGHSYSTFKEEDEAGSDEYIDEIEKINSIVEKRVQKYLDVVIGSGDYEASVSVSLSREKVQQNQTIYTEGAVGSKQRSSENLDTTADGAEVQGPGVGSGKKYNSENVNETLLPSFEQKSVTYLPGRITDVTVALAVDKSVPAMISLQQLRESVAAVIGPQASADNVKITVVDLHSANNDSSTTVTNSNKSFTQKIATFMNGGTWSFISKILMVIGIAIALLLIAIIGLNFLGAASNRNFDTEIDPSLGDDFEDVLNESYEPNNSYEDFGESDAFKQQEELLREMMMKGSSTDAKQRASDKEMDQLTANQDDENIEFENLLNNFQSVASAKPEALAKKIQVWLEDE
jgi:flagellar biosynthesis/type III secretory pathway M-ring protein FliF/YscJ